MLAGLVVVFTIYCPRDRSRSVPLPLARRIECGEGWNETDGMAERKRRSSKLAADTFDCADGRRHPEVILEFLFDRGLLSVSVRNIGTRAAMKVAVTFDRKFTGLGGSKVISSLPLFRNIEFLGPSREIVTLLDTSESYFKRKQPTKIAAHVSYLDADERKYETTIDHDLAIYRELSWVVSSATNREVH